MKAPLIATLVVGMSLLTSDVGAQSLRERLGSLARGQVEEKVRERVAHELGVENDITSPVEVEYESDPKRPGRMRRKVGVDPISGAQVAMMGHNQSLAAGRFYPEDHQFIPPVLEGYTHVRRGQGQWLPASARGISTCDPRYIVLAKAGRTDPIDQVPSDCLRMEGQIVGGRKLANPDQFDAMNAGASREEAVASYQDRVATLSATDKFYFRGGGDWVDVDGGVMLKLSSQHFTNSLGFLAGPNVVTRTYGVGVHRVDPGELAFFIPLTAAEIASQAGPSWNAKDTYFNENWSTVFYRVTSVRPCRGDMYLINVVVDEVRYHLGRDANSPHRSWTRSSAHTLPTGVPENARASGHEIVPEQHCKT